MLADTKLDRFVADGYLGLGGKVGSLVSACGFGSPNFGVTRLQPQNPTFKLRRVAIISVPCFSYYVLILFSVMHAPSCLGAISLY